MNRIGVEELLSNSGINHKIKIFSKGGSKGMSYTLKGIDGQYLHLTGDVGFPEKISIDTISEVEFEDGIAHKKKDLDQNDAVKIGKFIKEKNRLGADICFEAYELFKNELSILAKKIDSDLLKEYLLNHKRNLMLLDQMQAEVFLGGFERMEEEGDVDRYVIHIGKVIVFLSARKWKECVEQCFRLLDEAEKEENKRKVCLCLAYVMNYLKDDDQSFYWLEKYFLAGVQALKEDSNYALWWRYLRGTVEFASYGQLGGLLERIFAFDKKLACESLAYVLALNNANLQANRVLAYMEQADLPWEIVQASFWQLRSETDNKYHRFVKCVNHIMSKGRYRAFQEDKGIEGLVYEYVPIRSYGFIIGYDMIKYFFHNESVDPATGKSIKEAICSIKRVQDEELCQVNFSRSSECKRAYEAYDIV
ncbi:hypothetical protein D7X48_03670 [bacterium D16-50]|nr:hypothetical protein D7X48_03670 [bacterium D16-50]